MKLYKIVFSVKGSGQFPIDMLRYDGCYPHSQEDSAKIECTSMRTVKLEKLTDNKSWMPTSKRWESFLFQEVGTITKDVLR